MSYALDADIVKPMIIIPICKKMVPSDLFIQPSGNLKINTSADPSNKANKGDPINNAKNANKIPINNITLYAQLIKLGHCGCET